MNQNLLSISSVVNEWLRFAEAKNGALVAIGAGISVGLIQVWPASPIFQAGVVMMCIFSCVAVLIALYSFMPRLETPFWRRKSTSMGRKNLLFFGDIAGFSPKDYLLAVQERYPSWGIQGLGSKEEVDCSEQIVMNSAIALRKFKLFQIALTVWAAGVLFAAVICLAGIFYPASRI